MVGYLGGHLYSVEDVVRMSKEIAAKVAETPRPDMVVGILRDGALPALEIAGALGVPFDFIEIKRTFGYSPPVLVRGLSSKISKNSNVLLVDDVYDSGRTIKTAREFIAKQTAGRVTAAVLNYMEEGEKVFHEEAPGFWIIRDDESCFPWRSNSPYNAEYESYLLRKGFVRRPAGKRI